MWLKWEQGRWGQVYMNRALGMQGQIGHEPCFQGAPFGGWGKQTASSQS